MDTYSVFSFRNGPFEAIKSPFCNNNNQIKKSGKFLPPQRTFCLSQLFIIIASLTPIKIKNVAQISDSYLEQTAISTEKGRGVAIVVCVFRAFFWTFWKKLKPEKTQNSSNFLWKLKQNFRKTQKPPTQLELLQYKSCIFIPKMCRRLNFSVNPIHYKLYNIQKLLIFRIQ